MDIKHLHYFIEVVRFKSFTQAAEHLFITQPTISKMIKNLEEELGVQLFKRSRKKLTLTDAGQVIYEQALSINKAFRSLEMELDDLLSLKKGVVRIGVPPIIDSSFIPKLLGDFHEKFNDINFHLEEEGSKKIEEEVSQDLLDAGLVVLPTNEGLFDYFPLEEEDFKLIVHPGHHLADKEQVNLEELKNESFILFNKDFALHDRILSSCISAGFTPRIISETSQWDFIAEMVACKLGVTLLPASICNHLTTKVKAIKVVNPSISWKLAIIWRKDHYLSYAAREWLSFTKEQFSN
ncbi:LysR family transcriptional regulator [Metabacillus sp. GX 13764]|uniref:cidABC operon transcriptional activator CidR n=1 Tax=Metabacillus kandeliae TaxID=2900151 RepID=UPI001E297A6C|nr:LysR family transcriptional regulator [Metabacillus kandeliae]MCD7036691.1 LysR family transcriptional regulator [Metabacillus kandeliae]